MDHSSAIRSVARRAVYILLAGVLAAAGMSSPAGACDTPVYRYAMYNWPPAPYYVLYFYHGQAAKQDEAVNQVLDGLCRAEPPANVVLQKVDVADKEQFERLPKLVRQAYRSHAEGQQPLHLVYPSWVLFYAWANEQYARAAAEEGPTRPDAQPPLPELFAGRLDKQKIEAMVDSPARKQLGKLLNDGNAAVLLILTGPDENANRQAEKAAADVVAMAAGGRFSVSVSDGYTAEGFLPEASDDSPASGARQGDAAEKLKLAALKLSRSDPAEKWLVDSLLSVEPDLRESQFAKSAMIFAVFGRGRVMPPFVGKGITAENLAEGVSFLTGPCSCVIKDQNPGADLLIRRDWDAVAEAWAANDPRLGGGAPAGGPWGYQEFVAGDSDNPTQTPAGEDLRPELSPTGDPQPKAHPQAGPRQARTQPPLAQPAGPLSESQSIAAEASAQAPAQLGGGMSDSFALWQALRIGIWLGAGTAVVLIAGFVLVLRRRPN
jgi:hypothetical protein